MRGDDFSDLMGFVSQAGAGALGAQVGDFGYHQGLVIAWNPATNANTIRVQGTDISNIPVLTAAGIIALEQGDPVGILRYKTSYFVLGRIVAPGSNLAQPQFAIPLYPAFLPAMDRGQTGDWIVDVPLGAGNPAWTGRFKGSHSKVSVDGTWGRASGTGTTTYDLFIDNNTTVGSWTVDGFEIANKGPFDISAYLGRDWVEIKLRITGWTGNGARFFQPYACYFRS